MSDKAHIRDFLAVTRDEMQAGKVSTTAICGERDPDMNKLEFADFKYVIKKKMNNYCEKCRNKWLEEEDSLSGQKKAMNKFRKIVQGQTNFSGKK